jgi:hypothetical protein
MYIMKKVAQQTKGMGLNIMKFHGILQLMEDIQVNGVPLEFDTAANESHHKALKYAAQLTQKNESVFQIPQIANRLWEFKILNYAIEELKPCIRITDYFDVNSDESSESSSEPPSISAGCTNENDDGRSDANKNPIDNLTNDARIIVFLDEKTQEPSFKMSSRSKYANSSSINIDLLTFLFELQERTLAYLPSNSLPIFTHHQCGSVIFHAHPNYRGKGAWKD